MSKASQAPVCGRLPSSCRALDPVRLATRQHPGELEMKYVVSAQTGTGQQTRTAYGATEALVCIRELREKGATNLTIKDDSGRSITETEISAAAQGWAGHGKKI